MERRTKKIRKRWLHVRLDDTEHQLMMDNLSSTTEKKLSTYARKILLSQPVTVVHRDGSMDALIAVLVRVQNDLNGVANNYNQMVHKLHMAGHCTEVKQWLSFYEKEKHELFESISQIKEVITIAARKWLQ